MTLYSISDADYLISYYSDKLINQNIEASLSSKIIRLGKEDYGNNTYRVNAYGSAVNGVVYPKRDIESVARYLNLILPDEVLKKRDQQL